MKLCAQIQSGSQKACKVNACQLPPLPPPAGIALLPPGLRGLCRRPPPSAATVAAAAAVHRELFRGLPALPPSPGTAADAVASVCPPLLRFLLLLLPRPKKASCKVKRAMRRRCLALAAGRVG